MKIISISLSEKNIQDLENIKQLLGKANNSEAIRTTIKTTLEKLEQEKNIKGIINAVLIITHSHKTEKFVSNTKHEYKKIIKIQNHYCTKKEKCIDYFILQGSAKKIKEMKNKFQKNKGIEKTLFLQI
ncbi:MAG: hypothetical protein QXD98_02455 [Candidatus Diapherotrites archaeon]